MNSKALRYRLSKKRPGEIIGSKAGFTLAELLVAMGIMAMGTSVGGMLMSPFKGRLTDRMRAN